MKSLDRATKIRRTVANKAYTLLKDCKEPEQIFGSYEKEHWHIDQQRLEEEVIDELADEWPEADDDTVVEQIQFFCGKYLDSKDYEQDKKEIRNEYYQYQEDIKDLKQTNRAHQPTWRP